MECVTFTYIFRDIKQAKEAAKTIKEWTESNLKNCMWIDNLFPVITNTLSIGHNTAISFFDYYEKINRLADVIHEKYPDFIFYGEQEFCNTITGFQINEKFACAGKDVEYTIVEICDWCNCKIGSEKIIEVGDLIFCSTECAREYLVEYFLEEDYDEYELEEMSLEELILLFEEN